MHVYYIANIPFSDELYHHGTKGQRWGRRLYQNEDGSLTALGRIHYGVGKPLNSVAKKIKASAKRRSETRMRRKLREHPERMTNKEIKKDTERYKLEEERQKAKKSLSDSIAKAKVSEQNAKKSGKIILKKKLEDMTNEELKLATERINLENSYKEAKAKLASKSFSGRVKPIVASILESGARTIANKAFNKLADNLFKEPEKKDETTDWKEILENPERHTDKEVQNAFNRSKNLSSISNFSKILNPSTPASKVESSSPSSSEKKTTKAESEPVSTSSNSSSSSGKSSTYGTKKSAVDAFVRTRSATSYSESWTQHKKAKDWVSKVDWSSSLEDATIDGYDFVITPSSSSKKFKSKRKKTK